MTRHEAGQPMNCVSWWELRWEPMTDAAPRVVPSTLIIDDSEGDVLFAKLMLKRSGRYRHVDYTHGGESALELFLEYEKARAKNPEAFPPSVVFLDINMPRMTGFEFLEELSKLQESTPELEPTVVLMLSSSGESCDRERAAEFSCVRDFVVKPLSVDRAIEIADRFGGAEA